MSQNDSKTDPHIIKSCLTEEIYPLNSLIAMLIDRLETDPDQNCLIDCMTDRKWSKRQVLESTLNFANYLLNECHLRKGEIISFFVDNNDIHYIALIGVLCAGGVYSSKIYDSSERDIIGLIELAKPSIVVCSEQNYQTIIKVVEMYSYIRKLLIIENELGSSWKTEYELPSIERIFTQKGPDIKLPIDTDIDDCVTLVMSSGTTGQPKAIQRTNRNLLSYLAVFQHKQMCPLTSQDIILAYSLCFSTGQMTLFMAINVSAQLAIHRFEDNQVDIMHKYEITHAFLSSAKLKFLAKSDHAHYRTYLKSLRDVWTGGAHLPSDVYNIILDKYDIDKFRIVYGMSEIGTSTMVYECDLKILTDRSTVGKLTPGVQCKVIDENGFSLGPNKPGQLCFKSGMVTPGYLNNDRENAQLFTEDKFLKTGDYGYYDENEFFYIIRRIKDIIKVQGLYNISPVEFEHILLQNVHVENAAVIGIEDIEGNEVPMAFVTLVKGSNTTADEIKNWFNSRVTSIMQLTGGLKIIAKFPLTPLQKINKNALKQMITEL